MKTIVITGSTRGLGRGLAEAFLQAGCQVVVSGRQAEGVERAVASLASRQDPSRLLGHPCDVGDYAQVEQLWQAAHTRFGQIDIWINNAGINNTMQDFHHSDPAEMERVIHTNLLGAMYGARVALAGMLAQGSGAIYTMEGLGSTGRQQKGLGIYGTTKAALRYFNQSLALETANGPIISGALRPGMVATEMLTSQYAGRPDEWQRVLPIFNILSDRVETVAPWLAQRVLANRRNGVLISWTNPWRLLGRFLTAPFHKRDVFSDFEV